MNSIKIYKVGGAVLGNSDGFSQFLSLVKTENSPAVFVISAFNLTTRELKNAAILAENKDYKSAKSAIDKIFNNHLKFSELNIPESFNRIKLSLKPIKNKALRLIRGISLTGFLSKKTLDSILAIGEEIALSIISTVYFENSDIECIDSGNLIVTDNNYNQAGIIPELCAEKISKILPILKQKKRIITQGFTARSIDGHTTTMGLESSNLTATILADVLNVKDLVIQTNVDGIFNADPKVFSSVKLIEYMDYDFAKSSAMNGLKLIYGDMIDIAKKKNMRIIFESGINHSSSKTIIDNFEKSNEYLIIVQNNIGIVRIHFNSYKERRYVIDKLLNDKHIRANVIYSNLMEDYVEFVLNNEVSEFQKKFTEIQIFSNLTLVKIINSKKIDKLYDIIKKFESSIISGLNFINSDNNLRILFKNGQSSEFINEILSTNQSKPQILSDAKKSSNKIA